MNFIDIIIIIFLISSLFRGRDIGFVRQLFSTVGFFGGLLLGAVLEPHVVQFTHSSLSRSVLTVFVTLGMALLLLSIGEYVGVWVKRRVQHREGVNHVDNVFGSALAAVSLLAIIWLSAAIVVTLPYPRLQSAIRGSAIVSAMTRQLPPAPTVIADLGRLIDPNGFPEVFTDGEPSPKSATPATPAELAAAVNRDQASVVKVEGQGCGGVVEGSGFVVAPGLIATNAHVVAGIQTPYVLDNNGTHRARAIWFDPDLDFAVLAVGNLAGQPLDFVNTPASYGTKGGVLGYPGGGNFSAKTAAVLDEFTATGRNIYNQGATERDVYSVQADIIPGNSGGPLVDLDGNVIGVVFATSTEYNHVGYALSAPQVIQEINQAKAHDQTVSTGSCAE